MSKGAVVCWAGPVGGVGRMSCKWTTCVGVGSAMGSCVHAPVLAAGCDYVPSMAQAGHLVLMEAVRKDT